MHIPVEKIVQCTYSEQHEFVLCLIDGPLPEPSMVRPTGPNQMVNRMQGPGKTYIV